MFEELLKTGSPQERSFLKILSYRYRIISISYHLDIVSSKKAARIAAFSFALNARTNKKIRVRSVSRVLSCTVIYLAAPSPVRSSDIHGKCRASNPMRHPPNLAPNGVCTARRVTAVPVSSYLPFPSLQISLRSVSVALSLESPPPDVIRRSALRCSDFPHGASATRPYNRLGSFFIISRIPARCQVYERLGLKVFLFNFTCVLTQNVIQCICEKFGI